MFAREPAIGRALGNSVAVGNYLQNATYRRVEECAMSTPDFGQ